MTNNRGQEERGWGSHGQSCSGISVQRGRSWDKVDRGKKVSTVVVNALWLMVTMVQSIKMTKTTIK